MCQAVAHRRVKTKFKNHRPKLKVVAAQEILTVVILLEKFGVLDRRSLMGGGQLRDGRTWRFNFIFTFLYIFFLLRRTTAG